MANSTESSMTLRTQPPIPQCDGNLCTTGQAAACPASSACKPTSGTCAPAPLNREPGAVCGGASTGYCAAARDASAVNAPCVCAEPYAGANCGLCAPGFYAVAYAPWGPLGERCVQTPLDMRQLSKQRAASFTTTTATSSDAETGPPQPPAPPQGVRKRGLSGGVILWILGVCALAMLLVAVAACCCACLPAPVLMSPLQYRGRRRTLRRQLAGVWPHAHPTQRPALFVREFALQEHCRGTDDC